MKVRLNKRTIDEAVYEGPRGCYLRDTQQPGFGVRIYPTGAQSFVVSYYLDHDSELDEASLVRFFA